MKKDLKQFLEKTGVDIADQDIASFSKVYEKLVEAKTKIKNEKDRKKFNKIVKELSGIEKKEKTLFPNEIPAGAFGMPSIASDNLSNAIYEIDDQKDLILERLNSHSLYNNSETQLQIDRGGQLSFKFDEEINTISSEEEIDSIFDLIKRTIKDGVVLQHYCALWNYATKIQNSFRFAYVKIDDILETFLKKPSNGYFRQTTRENFTKSIRTLQKMKLRIPVKTKNKTKVEGNKYINMPLLNFELSTENKKGTVMLDLTGELLGSNYQNNRGRIFPEGIFQLDSRSEGERISLAFKIATRFDQLNHKPIEWDRQKFIQHAGLEKTDKINRGQASVQLEETLKRLKTINCISDFFDKKITNDNNQKIIIYSPFGRMDLLSSNDTSE